MATCIQEAVPGICKYSLSDGLIQSVGAVSVLLVQGLGWAGQLYRLLRLVSRLIWGMTQHLEFNLNYIIIKVTVNIRNNCGWKISFMEA